MVKFYKPGKVVIVLKGKYAGRKGIIIKSNYESMKDRKYPHCIVIGLSKGVRKPTKRSLKKYEEKVKALEAKGKDKENELAKLKSLGVFIKTFNMAHLLVTRYSIKEDFGMEKSLSKLDAIENTIKEKQSALNRKTAEKKEESKKEIDELKDAIGKEKDNYKQEMREVKKEIGTEMLGRFMQGFVKGDNSTEIEKQEHTEFFFKKLNF